jgi:hypothetical protein
VYGRFRIALVELTCPWDTDAKRGEEHKTARYADLKKELSNPGWDCSLYLIEVGARGQIVKSVKDCLRSLFRAWLPAGHRSGIGQMIKDVSRISLVCSFAIFQACNDSVCVFSMSCHATYRCGAIRNMSWEMPGETPSPCLPLL